jgi:hypothetical protein
VRYYYANTVALTAAKAGKPLPDGSVLFAEVYSARLDGSNNPVAETDGFFVPDKLLRYTLLMLFAGGEDRIIPVFIAHSNGARSRLGR